MIQNQSLAARFRELTDSERMFRELYFAKKNRISSGDISLRCRRNGRSRYGIGFRPKRASFSPN